MATMWHRYGGFAVSVFLGVLLGSVLSRHMPVLAAWFVGGFIMGLAPPEPRGQGKRLALAVATGAVVAVAAWLGNIMGGKS